MSYFDLYKKKLMNNGGSVVGEVVNNQKTITIENFRNDPSYKKAKLTKLNLGEEDIDIRVVNVDRSVSDKRIYLLPDLKVDEGSYISYEDKIYLVSEFEDNLISPMCKGTLCNQMLKLPNGKEYPCVIANDAYGSKINLSNDFIGQIDTKLKIQIQANTEVLRECKLDMRCMFNHSKFDIFKCTDINTSVKKGVVTLIAKKDVYLDGLDNLEENIAFNGVENNKVQDSNEYVILGEDTIRINNNFEYILGPTNEGAIYSLDNYTIENNISAIVSQSNGKCILKANISDEIITLNCSINGEIVASKDIVTVKR